MAKMFYTMEETKASLGRNEEEIKQLAREGRLREFRDGPRLMFKADQVEQLKGELGSGGGGDAINIAHGESGAPIGLAGDSRTGSSIGSGIALVENTPSPAMGAKGDTHMDIGLSGSLGGSVGGSVSGIPSPGRAGPRDSGGTHMGSGSGILNIGSGVGSGGSRAGITVFDVDDSQKVDPSAQTAINPSVQDQINLEGVGSGSGLLDLTRESDDTSLGAVFDELTPGARRTPSGHRASAAPAMMETQAGADFSVPEARSRGTLAAPIYVEAPDPLGSALGWAALAVAGILVFAGFILAGALRGMRPEILDKLQTDGLMFAGIAVAVVLAFAAGGFVAGKMSAK
jgi:hypothetical protein